MQTLSDVIKVQNAPVDKMPKKMTLDTATKIDDINSILSAMPRYKDSKTMAFLKGFSSGFDTLQDIVPSIQLYGETAELAIGGYFGAKKEYINRKALNIATIQRNLMASQRERYKDLNPDTANSWSFNIGSGAASYLTMAAVGGSGAGALKLLGAGKKTMTTAATVLGLSTNALLENVEQQSERIPLDSKYNIDVSKLTPEWARNSTIGTTSYLAVSSILEKYIGFGKQVSMWQTPIKVLKNRTLKGASAIMLDAGKTALSEGLTEGLQSLASTGILFADGTINVSQLPERIQQAWKEAIIGTILGGTVGTAVAINQQHNVKTMLNEEISKVISDPEEVSNIVDAIYDTGTINLTNVISTELELSSELKNKHGAIYDNMSAAIYDAIKASGAMSDVSESELSQYVSDTSRMFADQVLAEANKRGVLIDEVLKAGDIKFANGMIQLKSGKDVIAETPVAEMEVEAKIVEPDLVDKFLDEQNYNAEKEKKFEAELKERDRIGIALLTAAANVKGGKKYSAKQVRNLVTRIRNGNLNKSTDEFLNVIQEPEDRIISTGLLTSGEVMNFYAGFNEDNQEKLVDTVLRDLTENRTLVEDAEEEHYNKIAAEVNKFKTKVANAKTTDELDNILADDSFDETSLQLTDEQNNDLKQYIEDKYDAIKNAARNQENDIRSEINSGTTERTNLESNNKNADTERGTQQKQGIDKNNPDIYYQSAMYKSNKENFDDFYDYVTTTNTPKAKSYFTYTTNGNVSLDIMHDIVRHDNNKHSLTKEEWKELFSVIDDNIIEKKPAYKAYYKGTPILLKIKSGDKYFGVSAEIFPDRTLITTAFKTTEKGVDTWLEKDSKRSAKTTAPNLQSGSSITKNNDVILGQTLNDIITYIKENINPDKLSQVKGLPSQPQAERGYFDSKNTAIKLLDNADFSTLPHELAHYWLDSMFTYVRSGKASENYLKNFEAVKDFLGLEDNQIYLNRNQHEKFARAYEKYLYNGYAPVGLYGAFRDYDKWLQKVYNSANQLHIKLTSDIIDFFESMTTGDLQEYSNIVQTVQPETVQAETVQAETVQAETEESEQKPTVEENSVVENVSEKVEETIQEETKQAVQEVSSEFNGPVDYNTLPAQTNGDKNVSSLANLVSGESLEYNEINIKEQIEKANKFVRNNLEQARDIVNGKEQPPKDILKNAIFKAYANYMKEIGNTDEFLDTIRTLSLTSTRMGQEISVLRDSVEDIYSEEYWINRIENIQKNNIARKKFKKEDDAENIKLMNEDISKEVDAVMDDFLKADATEQEKIAENLANKIAKDYDVNPDILYQSMKAPNEIRTKSEAYKYIYKAVNNKLGFQLTKEQAEQVIAKVNNMQKSMEQTIAKNGNPSVLFFKNLAEMENYANSLAPTPALMVLTSIIGRGNMLASTKSISLNIESNIVNYINEAIIKRLTNKISVGAVDKQAINDYLKYSMEVYKASGYQVSSMPTLTSAQQILSEKMIKSQGKTGNVVGDAIRGLGRFYEQTIFKYGMGGPDLIFKDRAFVSTADLLATKAANGDAKKATEIFKDAILVEPKTEIGKEIREKAINDALVATYQQNGNFSKNILQIRNALNKMTYDIRLGDLLSPFVKTPTNVIGLGFDYSIGGLKAISHLRRIVKDFQSGKLTDVTKDAIRSAARNGLGLIVAGIIASFIDEKDYIPEYVLCSPKERELTKLKGGNFNSIKMGDKYIHLDYFGPVGSALVGLLMAKKKDNPIDAVGGYIAGSSAQMANIPVIREFKEMLENIQKSQIETVKTGTIAFLEQKWKTLLDFANSRLIPAVVNDIAKSTDGYERETSNDAVKRIQAKIPVLREELPKKYNYATGRAIKTESALGQFLAGVRVKTEINNSTIREIEKISKTDNVTLSQVTKTTPAFKQFSAERKAKIEREFAQNYAERVSNLIDTNEYQNMDYTERAKEINKIRKDIVDDIKVEYGLKEPKKPKRARRKRGRRK